MKILANLTEEQAKELKAQLEQQHGGCVDVYQCRGEWRGRRYKAKRGPKPGTKYRPRSEQQPGGMAASQ